ncbi:MAG: hypothetical protein AB7D33_04660, partial [Sphingobium sp.]
MCGGQPPFLWLCFFLIAVAAFDPIRKSPATSAVAGLYPPPLLPQGNGDLLLSVVVSADILIARGRGSRQAQRL